MPNDSADRGIGEAARDSEQSTTARYRRLWPDEAPELGFKAHPHMLRHACGFAPANSDTWSLQAYLGHKNIRHTVRYTAPAASFDHLVDAGTPGSFGQPRLPKSLNQQLRICLRRPAPSNPRRDCKCGIDLKHTRRRLPRLSVTSEMGEQRIAYTPQSPNGSLPSVLAGVGLIQWGTKNGAGNGAVFVLPNDDTRSRN